MSEQMREEFEKSPRFRGMDFTRSATHPEYYESPYANGAWDGWQASRAALVVELPSRVDAKPYACYEGGWNDMHDEAREAIEAAGVRVKPCP
ncbi:hypothetical protein [Pseudomonas sp. NFACC05-1]|uniref:hypothetical protein n=1 Tax=Pseudomonas sp. NFACC05-1 TaxID=1566241 RepID=UPI00111330EC|nr:hypothetical protein [Pseudomonas sp. NFACC05-1]